MQRHSSGRYRNASAFFHILFFSFIVKLAFADERPVSTKSDTLKKAVGGRFDIGVGVGLKAMKTDENKPLDR